MARNHPPSRPQIAHRNPMHGPQPTHPSVLDPNRKSLLDMNLNLINGPWFLESRPWPLENLQPFDRQAYLDAIAAFPDVYIPDDFAMWILEWPERAVIRCLWPGLPFEQAYQPLGDIDLVQRRPGWNCLGMIPPTVRTVPLLEYILNSDGDLQGDDAGADLGTDDGIDADSNPDTNDVGRICTQIPVLLLFDEMQHSVEFLLLHSRERLRGFVVAGYDHIAALRQSRNFSVINEPSWPSWLLYLQDSVSQVEFYHQVKLGNYIRNHSAQIGSPPLLSSRFDSLPVWPSNSVPTTSL
ncbi:hypothetical protein HGRIS_011783 [Hohenbuehelia grisea]|uniref:Uncharacterized protein n=1 Tax=Hohenbuehelia grisea TaxID=104357 RepID=A0ABR3JYD1_9AGAR